MSEPQTIQTSLGKIAFQIHANASGPLVVALAGISSCKRLDLWKELIGPGKCFDTDELRVLSFDYLGGSDDSFGPKDADFNLREVKTHHQAQVLAKILDFLGEQKIALFLGASYGGMVALAFAQLFPDRCQSFAIISASHRPNPLATAWRSLQRKLLEWGREVNDSDRGVELARALAMTTYRSDKEFDGRFKGPTDEEGLFPVEKYIYHQGKKYTARANSKAYQLLSASIDSHSVEVGHHFPMALLIGFTSDLLIPPWLMRELKELWGPKCSFHLLESDYGHDAHLLEIPQLNALIRPLLKELPCP